MDPGEDSSGRETSRTLAPRTATPSTPTTEDDDSPTTPVATNYETSKMPHDSMVTVRLSEPPALTLDTSVNSEEAPKNHTVEVEVEDTDRGRNSSREFPVRSSLPAVGNTQTNRSIRDELDDDVSSGRDNGVTEDQDDVNWERLERTEDEQPKDEETDNVCCSCDSG